MPRFASVSLPRRPGSTVFPFLTLQGLQVFFTWAGRMSHLLFLGRSGSVCFVSGKPRICVVFFFPPERLKSAQISFPRRPGSSVCCFLGGQDVHVYFSLEDRVSLGDQGLQVCCLLGLQGLQVCVTWEGRMRVCFLSLQARSVCGIPGSVLVLFTLRPGCKHVSCFLGGQGLYVLFPVIPGSVSVLCLGRKVV